MDEILIHSPQTYTGGESPMIGFELWTEVHSRFRQGQGKRKIARELGLDRKTVRRILAQERPVPYQRTVTRPTKVAPYLDYLRQRAPEVDYNAYRLFQELQTQGYPGGYEMVKVAIRPLRAERAWLAEATVRFETPPGRQAQVDWGRAWVWLGGERRRVHAFVMVLSSSRALYVEFTEAETLPTLLTCHEQAFDWFGGVPEEIIYDNPKTIVLKRDVEGQAITWNPQFWNFAQYYGFTPRPCRPYRAQTKGQGESGIKYGKRAFLLGRTFPSLADLNAQVQGWIRTVADQRVHGTTFRKPAEAFLAERLRSPVGKPRYQFQTSLLRKGASDCLVTVETNRSSVPPAYVGQTVEVQWGPGATVQISQAGALMATHPRANGQPQLCVDPVHDQVLRHRLAPKPVLSSRDGVLALTPGTGRFPEVAVRDLAWDEALVGQEVGHDEPPTQPHSGESPEAEAFQGPGAGRDPPAGGQRPGRLLCRLPGSAVGRGGQREIREACGDAHRHGPVSVPQDAGAV